MKVQGLDRIIIMVRDIHKALDFFSVKLGMNFKELNRTISERDGVRSFVCPETHIHLISPIFPLPENAAPPMKKRVELLKEHEAVFMALTFIVDDPEEAARELEKEGIRIQHRYPRSHDYASIGMDNFVEVVTSAEDTFGIVMGFANYDRAGGSPPAFPVQKGRSVLSVKALDRVFAMARDIDKVIDFLSRKMGMEFKELTKSISEREGVRCFVCQDACLEVVSPILPLPENAPPPVKKRVELLKEEEMAIVGLAFEVDDPAGAAAELERQGIGIQHTFQQSHDYVSIGMDNFVQVVAQDTNTFGITMAFGKYDRV